MMGKGSELGKLLRARCRHEELLNLAFHFMAWDEFNFRDPVLGKKGNTNQSHFGLIMKMFQEVAKSENGFLREPRFKCIEANDSQ